LKKLLVLAGLVAYTITYTLLIYVELPRATALSLHTLMELSSPTARVGLAC